MAEVDDWGVRGLWRANLVDGVERYEKSRTGHETHVLSAGVRNAN